TRTSQSIARYLLEQGATVLLNYRNDLSGVQELVTPDNQDQAIPIQGDVTSPEQVQKMFEWIQKRFGYLDGLVNVVGEYIEGPVMKLSFADWQRMFHSNLDSVFLMCQTLYPLLEKSKSGRVINFAYSNADRVVASHRVAYHIANMGVISLSKTFAKEWGKDKVTCNIISIGTLANSVTKDSENPADFIPIGRFGQPQDLFPVFDLIFREDSTYITGSNFIVSGGYNI
ncbi:MAG: NAD(P)-dependent dehydrogenase (short-subunit alcohol dehydrogenase family), partial [bacterium]